MPYPVAAARGHMTTANELAAPVPTLGAELLTNGDFETGDPPTGWNATAHLP